LLAMVLIQDIYLLMCLASAMISTLNERPQSDGTGVCPREPSGPSLFTSWVCCLETKGLNVEWVDVHIIWKANTGTYIAASFSFDI
ncbi:uncharacterized protein GGS25DRAFT_511203, partial [Hypoxylon fragiforme]|uniref:uncharacterized protein n=1 Tax=Hypoxylon fragiforme TaxID=63214 RepID=UPI0020C6A696